MAKKPPSTRESIKIFSHPRRFSFAGYLIILLTFGVAGGWAANAKIDSATVAPGTISLEDDRKVVQHLEGGIIKEILVREADTVAQGDVLIKLESIEARADVERLANRLKEARAVKSRLLAELQFAETITFPDDLTSNPTPELNALLQLQESILRDRLAIFNSQTEILQHRVEQLRAQSAGLERHRDALESRVELRTGLMERLSQGEELGVVRRNELTERQDLLIELDASLGEAEAEIARVQVAVGEAQLNSIKLRQEFLSRSNLELKDIQTQIAEVQEQTKVFEDILARTEIRAPSAGKVQNVSVTTVGSVVRPGEVLMEIVPQDDELLVTARISPLDIDNVLPGQETEVRLVAFKSTLTPIMLGTVESVSSDIITPDRPSEQPYFLGRIRVPEENMTDEVRAGLTPGMPADVVIVNGERSVLNYLIAPLSDAIAKSLNEQ